MPVAVVGASHRTAPIELRERLAFGRAEVPAVLADLHAGAGAEAVLLTTCNRTEFYLAGNEGEAGVEQALQVLSHRIGADPADAARWLYVRRDREAAQHLFRVAAGLDSMIVGEPQS